MSLAPVAVKKWWEKYVMQINLDTVKGDAGYQALVDARNEVQGSLLIKSVAAIKSQDAFKGRAAPELIKAVDNLARDVEKLNEAGGQEQEHIELDLKPSVPERLLEFYSFQKFHLKVRKLNFGFAFVQHPKSSQSLLNHVHFRGSQEGRRPRHQVLPVLRLSEGFQPQRHPAFARQDEEGVARVPVFQRGGVLEGRSGSPCAAAVVFAKRRIRLRGVGASAKHCARQRALHAGGGGEEKGGQPAANPGAPAFSFSAPQRLPGKSCPKSFQNAGFNTIFDTIFPVLGPGNIGGLLMVAGKIVSKIGSKRGI